MSPALPPLAANEPTRRRARTILTVDVEGTLAAQLQEQAVRAFATLMTDVLLDEPSAPMDNESAASVHPQQHQDIPPTQARSSA